MNIMLIIIAVISVLSLVSTLVLFFRKNSNPEIKEIERVNKTVQDEIARNRVEFSAAAKVSREEISNAIKIFENSVLARMKDTEGSQKNQLDTFSNELTRLTKLNEEKLDRMRTTMQENLKSLQEDNSKKLEKMRETVDEKLHTTLEKRLGESFKAVSEHLKNVHDGLGEMKTLASSVGDLKKVLTNVKTRGTWGEVQLGMLLEQILAPEQYESNVSTKKKSQDRVEFAIKLPGRTKNEKEVVWLPIDAKFPQEDYQRLVQAQEDGDLEALDKASKALEARIKLEAKQIKDKYLEPPHTTDFAIMFLPSESLYAEVLRKPALADNLRTQHQIVIAGPTTLAALLNSLQMGFRTLAVEKRSSEVWQLLGLVKREFTKFGDILDKTKKKLDEASKNIDTASSKTRTIERKLKNVEGLPSGPKDSTLESIVDDDAQAYIDESFSA